MTYRGSKIDSQRAARDQSPHHIECRRAIAWDCIDDAPKRRLGQRPDNAYRVFHCFSLEWNSSERQQPLGVLKPRAANTGLGCDPEARTMLARPRAASSKAGPELPPVCTQVDPILHLDQLCVSVTPSHEEVGRVPPRGGAVIEPDGDGLRCDRRRGVAEGGQRYEVSLQRAFMVHRSGPDRLEARHM
jgi:hypothetical protein